MARRRSWRCGRRSAPPRPPHPRVADSRRGPGGRGAACSGCWWRAPRSAPVDPLRGAARRHQRARRASAPGRRRHGRGLGPAGRDPPRPRGATPARRQPAPGRGAATSQARRGALVGAPGGGRAGAARWAPGCSVALCSTSSACHSASTPRRCWWPTSASAAALGAARRRRAGRRSQESLAALPGVQARGAQRRVCRETTTTDRLGAALTGPSGREAGEPLPVQAVGGDHFRTLGIPLAAGRAITRRRREPPERRVACGERDPGSPAHWPGLPAVGRTVELLGEVRP